MLMSVSNAFMSSFDTRALLKGKLQRFTIEYNF